ncbi:response regulator transcription factor [Caminibacter mediatlanticus TB-2]|uniref:Response regulator transcription factor n=1 Tax=Caminibacter mediatlanticus TB-2 TaxID=391592 RepID=A0AAI9AGV8_9BACT|nr:response regulator transcription factor [Caminibacter mediatlanticus]EDM23380.1 two component transcriptional regulator, winged helix family protein [Caminibacter mediatlanticus TB-2]QCT93704.1 response regulator transcription factor [Caminibacter mediatlanticus TB-2]
MYSVLLVEDDLQLAKIVKKILESKDFIVTIIEDGNEALEYIKSREYDFYLIDINIPNINGLELVKYIKELKKEGKIIMITASVEEYNFKKAYEYGCDDYIKKPFHATELEVRINRLIEKKRVIEFDDYKFDLNTQDLYKNNQTINLRKKEKKLLYLLLKNINHTVDNQKIIEFVWNDSKTKNPPVRQLINELRKKFEKDYIKTVVGVGYRFEV